jgi:hypothetical protein
MISILLATALSAHVLLQATPHHTLPEASTILDRYVRVTHGASPSKQSPDLTVDFSVRDASGATYYATIYRGSAGRLHTVVDDDANPREWGTAGGAVWSLSKPDGARLLTGKAAARVLAGTRGLSAGSLAGFAAGWGGSFQTDDWRDAFPSVKTTAEATVHNQRCYEVLLTRKDGSTLRRWYDAQSGLLARETTAEFDQNGTEQTYETDVVEYTTSLAFTYPSVLHVKSGSSTLTVTINSLARGYISSSNAFDVPREVARIISQANTPDGMPNAIDLIAHFTDVVRGAQTRDPIRSEIIRANLSLQQANLKIPVVLYVQGRSNYLSFDMPTMGKFEYGSNRDVAWQRSVVLGPKLVPHSQFSGFLGPDIGEILAWNDEGFSVRTVRREEVNGSSCYVVEMSTKAKGLYAEAYFDAKTGYLVQMNTPGTTAEHVSMGGYRTEDGFTFAHQVETTLAGSAVTFAITEARFNAPIPGSVFNTPEDVAALLKQQQQNQPQGADPDLLARPSLRRRPAPASAH